MKIKLLSLSVYYIQFDRFGPILGISFFFLSFHTQIIKFAIAHIPIRTLTQNRKKEKTKTQTQIE